MNHLTSRVLGDREKELLAKIVIGPDGFARYDSKERIDDWATLKKMMLSLGGSWKGGKTQGFSFPEALDIDTVLSEARETGRILDPRAAGYFPTPMALARRVARLADLKLGYRVLEPSAGQGNLVHAVLGEAHLRKLKVTVHAVELLPTNVVELEKISTATGPGRVTVDNADFLSRKVPDVLFDRVVMNPPFAKKADIAHVRRALTWLEPWGKLVAIMSAGTMFREDRETSSFRAEIAERGGTFTPIEDGAFEESGTMVRTVMLTVGGSS